MTDTIKCSVYSKRVFRTEEAAKAALRRMKRNVINPFRLVVYHCTLHNGWHVGQKPFSYEAKQAMHGSRRED